MRTILVTGPIGGGKTTVCRRLASKGWPVYDSDSRTKALYTSVLGLKEKIEETVGTTLDKLSVIFTDDAKREALETLVYPEVLKDFKAWRDAQTASMVFFESAVALSKPAFRELFDRVWLVDAPLESRLVRNPKASQRDRLQSFDRSEADIVIINDGTKEELYDKTDRIMKTDLAKILAVSGYHGLYLYLAQSRANGAIAESLSDKKRINFPPTSRITTLEDIAIYTSEGEMKLSQVFTAMKDSFDGKEVPGSKAPADQIKAVFEKAVPNYDADRFYISHMKKVVDWYNELVNFASLDFVTDEDREKEAQAAAE